MEVLADSFIIYKNGFMEAKKILVKNYKLGIPNELDELSKGLKGDIWYDYGYEDGLHYYIDLIYTKNLDIEGINDIDVLQDFFTKRIAEINTHSEENSEKMTV